MIASKVQVTEAAKTFLKAKLTGPEQVIGLGVKKSGCAELSYVLSVLESPQGSELVFQDGDFAVYMKPQDLPYLQGIELDVHDDGGLSQYIKFNNPNAKGECGCGESFSLSDR